jgi:HD-like signal output (HDOD) protein
MTGVVAGDRPRLAGSRAGEPPNVAPHSSIAEVTAKLSNLPPLNAIASQVMAMAGEADVDLRALSKVIEGDTAFAADVLLLANSALFGFRSRMPILRQAIVLLGLERIKAMAVTIAMRGLVVPSAALVHQCWRHSAACAVICEEVSTAFGLSCDRAFTAGIMHDVGRLGLVNAYPAEVGPILKGEHADSAAVLKAERELLQADHACAGAWLVKAWALPQEFSEICACHHDAPNAQSSEMLQVVQVACKLADAIGFPAVKLRQPPSYSEALAPLTPRLGPGQVRDEDQLRSRVTAKLAVFEQ